MASPDEVDFRQGVPAKLAAVAAANGGLDGLDYWAVPVPTPGPGEVLRQVRAARSADAASASGRPRERQSMARPRDSLRRQGRRSEGSDMRPLGLLP